MTILVVVVAGLFAVMQVRATDRRRDESLEAYADLLGRLVLSNLRDAMVTKERARLQSSLSRIREIDPIVQVRVVNKPGEVIYADDEAAVGEVLGRDDPSCVICHGGGDPPRRRSATVRLQKADGRDVFRAIQPIRVESECVRCHDEPEGSVIGIVMTDIDRELLTGALGRQTTESIWAFVGAGILIIAALALLVGRLVVSRLRNLSRILELLRGGARSMALTTASGDEIDALTRAAHGLVLDLDERFAVERALHRAAPILERHAAAALVLDARGAVIAANRRARRRLGGEGAGSLVGSERAGMGAGVNGLIDEAREQGWALSADSDGPGVFALYGPEEAIVGFLELWTPEPPATEEESLAEEPGDSPSTAAHAAATDPAIEAEWRLYAAVVLQQLGAGPAWRGVLRLDPRLSLARRMIGELGSAAREAETERESIDLTSIALLARSDVQQLVPSVKWHAALDPPATVIGVRHQLRSLWVRIARAAAVQAGDGGHVVQFCYRARRGRSVYIGAWASRPGEGGDGALVDPPGRPPLAHAISSSHGGAFEVDPSYDLRGLVELRGLRVPTEGPGTLYVAEITDPA